MPALKRGQWELYARARAQGASMEEAARQAGYAKSTLNMAYRVDRHPEVQARIQELHGRIEDGIVSAAAAPAATVTRVLEEYGHIAFLDLAEAFDEHGNLLPIREMPEGVRRAIAGIEYEDIWDGSGKDRKKVGRLAKIKCADKIAALTNIGRYLGLFAKDKIGATEVDMEHAGIKVTIRSVLDKPGE